MDILQRGWQILDYDEIMSYKTKQPVIWRFHWLLLSY